MTRCQRCTRTWSGLRIAHCSECHRTFTTPANFDKHRAGGKHDGRKAGECNDPSLAGLVLSPRGYWAMPGRPDELAAS